MKQGERVAGAAGGDSGPEDTGTSSVASTPPQRHTPPAQGETLRPDRAGMQKALQRHMPGGPWTLTAIPSLETETFTDATAAGAWLEAQQNKKRNVYWTPVKLHRPMQKKPKKTDVKASLFAHADLDPDPERVRDHFDEEHVRLRSLAFALDPTEVVDSGGGFNVYWRLDKPCEDQARVEAVNKLAAACFGRDSDSGAYNVDRLLRVPCSVNFLSDTKRRAGRVPRMASHVEYGRPACSIDELETRFRAYAAKHGNDLGESGNGKAPPNKKPRQLAEAPPATTGSLPEIDEETFDAEFPAEAVRIAREMTKNDGTKYTDRNRGVLRFCCVCVREGVPDDRSAAVLTNRAFPISAHIYDQGGDPALVAERQVNRARKIVEREKVEDEAETAAELEKAAAEDWHDPGPMPADAMIKQLHGPLRDFIDNVRDASRRDDPVVALGCGLAMFSALLGRRVVGPGDTRPQLFIAALAPSGAGKNAPKECVANFLQLAGPLLQVAWETAVPYHRLQLEAKIMAAEGQLILIIDEYGETVVQWTSSAAKGDAASAAIRELATVGRTVYKCYPAKPDNSTRKPFEERWDRGILGPTLVILGLATVDAFYDALSPSSLTDGLLGRHLIFESKSVAKHRKPTGSTREFSPSILEWVKKLAEVRLPSADPGAVPPACIKGLVEKHKPTEQKPVEEHAIEFGEGARECFEGFCRDLDEKAETAEDLGQTIPAAILRRLHGQAVTLALVIACGEADDTRKAKIEVRHVELAVAICRWCARNLATRVQFGVAQSPLEVALETAEKYVTKKASEWVPRWRLARIKNLGGFIGKVWQHLVSDPHFQTKGAKVRLRPTKT